MCTVHAYQNTTATGWRQCSNCRRVERFVNGQWQGVEPPVQKKKKRRKGWDEAEHDMLNTSYQADYSDHRRASNDIRNYWR